MSSKRSVSVAAGLFAVVGLVGWAGGMLWAELVTTDALGGKDRYLAYVSTDKPIYRAGEKVYVRGVVMNAHDRTPLDVNYAHAMIEVKGPKGDTVATGTARVQDSVGGWAWEVPDGQPGGEYTIRFTLPQFSTPPAVRKFDIRAYRAPRLKSQIEFLRDGYGPGDEVTATLHVERAEGGFPVGANVAATARIDGEEVFTGNTTVNAVGDCRVTFTLPAQIERGEGTLTLAIEDGGVVETAAKTIPILLQTVDLTLFPEGGDLVLGLPTRIYFEAKTPAKKPADLAGVVVDADGRTVATFRSEHEGRGRFDFTPKHDGEYTLRITEPAGIKTRYSLPPVKKHGVVIRAIDEQTTKGQPVRLKVIGTDDGTYTVTLKQREQDVAVLPIELTKHTANEVTLTPPPAADGVLIATVWNDQGMPVAERLIYREPARAFHISINADKSQYVPGGKATLTVRTTDDKGTPISAVVGVTVTDDSVLEMIETREQAPRLPVMVLVENEVHELADAQVYLDPENADASMSLDLLLGTQGWRRFALVNSANFIKQHGDAARRVLALSMVSQRERQQLKAMTENLFRAGRFAGGGLGEGEIEAEGRFLDFGVVAPQAAAVDANGEGVDNFNVAVAGAELPGNAVDEASPPADKPEEAGQKDDRNEREDLDLALQEAQGERANQIVAGDMMGKAARRIAPMVLIREYAHQVRANRKPGERVDFTETLYWHAGVKTDAKTGEATVSFDLSDAVTSFRVFADGFTGEGALASAETVIESVEPFYIEPKLPLEVTAGDVVLLPVSVVRSSGTTIEQVALSIEAGKGIAVSGIEPFTMNDAERVRRILRLDVGNGNGPVDFKLIARAGELGDNVTRPLNIKPLGFPIETTAGGMLSSDASGRLVVVIPDEVVPQSITTNITVYPTPLASLTQSLERLIREPYGCFEQASSTIYPLVMAQDYFLSHTGVPVALIERSQDMLDKGYAKLIGYECKEKGYEWFGADPGHEALTAYGLLEFVDMARVHTVDGAMIERTRAWLLKRRDGKGGFERNAKALDSFGGAPEATTNAYITWALLEAGEKGLDTEVQAITRQALANSDSYAIALAANTAALAGDTDVAKKLMDKLVKAQAKDGHVGGAATSITRSGGEGLKIETTSLAVLAWLRDPAFAGSVEKAIKFLADSCQDGRFGSTQSTVLALRAIVAYDKARAVPKAPGRLVLTVDGKPVGEPVAFNTTSHGAITLPNIQDHLTPGEHVIALKMEDGSRMPYSMAVNYHATAPASSSQCKVALEVRLNDTKLTEGTATEAVVTLSNLTDQSVPTPVAIVGLPAGLEPRHDQLKELVKAGTIAAYEVRGREVICYWRGLTPEQVVRFPISVVAEVPGTYTAPASRAYEYYTDEHKHWVEGLRVEVDPRG